VLKSRRESGAEGLHTETKIDEVIQKSGDISQMWLDFSLFLLPGQHLFDG
jgi:hypothetical protein